VGNFKLHFSQRSGLYAGGELKFRPPWATADWKYFDEAKN
jgi:hypothetical protein